MRLELLWGAPEMPPQGFILFYYLQLFRDDIRIVKFEIVQFLFEGGGDRTLGNLVLNPEVCSVIAGTQTDNLYGSVSLGICLQVPSNDLADPEYAGPCPPTYYGQHLLLAFQEELRVVVLEIAEACGIARRGKRGIRNTLWSSRHRWRSA